MNIRHTAAKINHNFVSDERFFNVAVSWLRQRYGFVVVEYRADGGGCIKIPSAKYEFAGDNIVYTICTAIDRILEYEELTKVEIKDIKQQIDDGMRTTNGDTAPVTITARQAEILINKYEND